MLHCCRGCCGAGAGGCGSGGAGGGDGGFVVVVVVFGSSWPLVLMVGGGVGLEAGRPAWC
jgi:hypothetical protein